MDVILLALGKGLGKPSRSREEGDRHDGCEDGLGTQRVGTRGSAEAAFTRRDDQTLVDFEGSQRRGPKLVARDPRVHEVCGV